MSEGTTLRVEVHDERCIGSGRCTQIAPDVFGQEAGGLVVLHQPHPRARHRDAVRDARDSCPSRAIEVYEPTTTNTGDEEGTCPR